MLKVFLSLVVLISPMRTDPSFYVGRAEVYSDYGSIYILRLANQLVPPDKLVGRSEINCLLSEVKKTGLFTSVRALTIRKEGKDTRTLIVMARVIPKYRNIVISEIELVGFANVDKSRFNQALLRNDAGVGKPLGRLSLNEVMERITKALEETSPDGNDQELPWIGLIRLASGQVKLTVSPAYHGCGTTSPA